MTTDLEPLSSLYPQDIGYAREVGYIRAVYFPYVRSGIAFLQSDVSRYLASVIRCINPYAIDEWHGLKHFVVE